MTFERDEQKAEQNLRMHNVSFEESIGVFYDPRGLDRFDENHSSLKDERFIRLGSSKASRILWVVYTERKNAIRLISARKAGPFERKVYEKSISS